MARTTMDPTSHPIVLFGTMCLTWFIRLKNRRLRKEKEPQADKAGDHLAFDLDRDAAVQRD